jgi:hypothetical protein
MHTGLWRGRLLILGVVLLVLLGLGSQAQIQRFSELEVSDRLSVGQLIGIRLDLLELTSTTLSLPKSGLILGWGADLFGLGGSIIWQRVPSTLVSDFIGNALDAEVGKPGLEAGTYRYQLTILLDNYEVPQQTQAQVSVQSRGRVELRWEVNPQFVRLQRFDAKIGFRVYRAGPGSGPLGLIKELLNPDRVKFILLDDGLKADLSQSPPASNPTGNLILSGQLQVGSFAEAPTPLGIGAIYYDTTANNLLIWNGQSWAPLKGEKGDKGDPGPKGEKGDKGDPGQPQTPEGALALLQQLPSPLPLAVANAARADFATRAASADRASLADQAAKADRATIASAADRASFSEQAERANRATSAATADNAKVADTAKTADSATTAISAQKADSARTAESAGIAEVARQAEKASIAERAIAADKASVADRATTAGVADRASSAERAARADFADRASSADRAGNADRISGLSISDLESRFDSRYINVSGDEMVGPLVTPLFGVGGLIRWPDGTLARASIVEGRTWLDGLVAVGDRLITVNRQILQLSVDGSIVANQNVYAENFIRVGGILASMHEHPTDPTKEIIYVSLEGPEASIFLRGTAQLVNGEATITLPDYFSLIASEQGLLTVQLTPVGTWLQLYVVEKNTKHIIVREVSGKNGQFDYLVQAVRKGYEGHQVIQTKTLLAEMSKEALKEEELERLLLKK